MIQIKNGNVELTGTGPSILAELSTIVHALHYGVFIEEKYLPPEKSRELILEAVEQGFKEEADVEKEAKEKLLDVLDMIKEFLTRKDEE